MSKVSSNVPVWGTVYGTLLNYKGALEKLGDAIEKAPYNAPPIAPILYIKPANTLNSDGQPIRMPADVLELEIGAALGVVIGRKAINVSKEEALDYVAGYTIVNDVSVPHVSVYRPAVQFKARDGFCPIGPSVIERDKVLNPDNLAVRVFINNELRQENTTSNLIRPIASLIADVSEFMTLNSGDVLLVGVPENAPLARSGDNVRIEIEEIGSLENKIVYEKEHVGGRTK